MSALGKPSQPQNTADTLKGLQLTPEQQQAYSDWISGYPDAGLDDIVGELRQLGVQLPDTPAYDNYEAVFNDPAFRQSLPQGASKELIAQRATEYARNVYGLGSDWKYDENGKLVDSKNWLERNAWWVAPAAIVGSGIAQGALGGGSGAASTGEYAGGLDAGSTAGVDAGTTAATGGSAAAPTTVGGLTTPGVGSAATSPAWTTAGSGISGAAATGGTTAGTGAFSTFVNGMGGYRGLAGIGTNVLGSYLQSRAANNATDAQLAAAREALAVQAQEYNTNTGLNVAQANQNTQAYNTTVANLAPYRGIGAAAASMAGYSLGLPGYQNGRDSVVNAPPPITPIQPLAVPPPISVNGQPGQAIPNQAFLPTNQKTNGQPQFSTGNSWSPSAAKGPTGQMVTMQAPTGQVAQVPASQVQYYQQQGAKLLSTSSVQQPQGAA